MKPPSANNETIMFSGADRLSVRTKLLLTNGFLNEIMKPSTENKTTPLKVQLIKKTEKNTFRKTKLFVTR